MNLFWRLYVIANHDWRLYEVIRSCRWYTPQDSQERRSWFEKHMEAHFHSWSNTTTCRSSKWSIAVLKPYMELSIRYLDAIVWSRLQDACYCVQIYGDQLTLLHRIPTNTFPSLCLWSLSLDSLDQTSYFCSPQNIPCNLSGTRMRDWCNLVNSAFIYIPKVMAISFCHHKWIDSCGSAQHQNQNDYSIFIWVWFVRDGGGCFVRRLLSHVTHGFD